MEDYKSFQTVYSNYTSDKQKRRALENTARGKMDLKQIRSYRKLVESGKIQNPNAIQEIARYYEAKPGTVINPFTVLLKYGPVDGILGDEAPEKDPLQPMKGVTNSVDKAGTRHEVTDLVALDVGPLVDYYLQAEAVATVANAPVLAINQWSNASKALIDEVLAHPGQADLVFEKLGGAGGKAAGKEKFLDVFHRVFFMDESIQRAILADYQTRKERFQYNLGQMPKDPYKFDFAQHEKDEDALLIVAFTEVMQQKFGSKMNDFKRKSFQNEQINLNNYQQVIEFFGRLGIQDMAGYIDQNITIDRGQRYIGREGNGVTRTGGVFDQAGLWAASHLTQAGHPTAARIAMGVADGAKIAYKVVEKGAAVVAGFRIVKTGRHVLKNTRNAVFKKEAKRETVWTDFKDDMI